MQGDQSEKSLIDAIRGARAASSMFDVLVVIRGGGSKVDLSCFDSYAVARELATFPLPVITGIGHERDESVLDIVAHLRCKTPTAAAEYLVRTVQDFESELLELQARIVRGATGRLSLSRAEIERCAMLLQKAVIACVTLRERDLGAEEARARTACLMRLEKEKSLLDRLSDKVALLDPINVLRRGYSLVYDGSTLVRSVKQTAIAQNLLIRLSNGYVDTEVKKIQMEAETDAI
jgi:exodeoxyribonuclease VII large subunit